MYCSDSTTERRKPEKYILTNAHFNAFWEDQTTLFNDNNIDWDTQSKTDIKK